MAGLRDAIKKRMDALSKVGEDAPPPAVQPVTTATVPTAAPAKYAPAAAAEEAAKKAARFKWERENPGVPYVEKKVDGGIVAGSNPPALGLRDGMFGGFADGGPVFEDGWTLADLPQFANGGLTVEDVQRGYLSSGPSISQGGSSFTPAPLLNNFQRVGAGDLASMARPDSAGGVTMPTVSAAGLRQAARPPLAPSSRDRVIQPPSVSGFKYNPSMKSNWDPANPPTVGSSMGDRSTQSWNRMADAYSPDASVKDRVRYGVSTRGYPLMADGGAVGMRGIGGEVGDGWRKGAVISKAKQRELQRLRNGGKVKKCADGGEIGQTKLSKPGMISGVGGPTEDRQPILASPGEFIVPADTVDKVGEENLSAMVAATHTPVRQGMRAAANGVIVDDFGNLIDAATGKPVAPTTEPTNFAKAKSMAGGAANTAVEATKSGAKKAKKWLGGLRNRVAPPAQSNWEYGNPYKGQYTVPPDKIFTAQPAPTPPTAEELAKIKEASVGPRQPRVIASVIEPTPDDAARATARRAATKAGFTTEGLRQPGFIEGVKQNWQAQGGMKGLGQQVIPDTPGERYAGSEEYKGAGKPGAVSRGVRFLGRATPALEAVGQAYSAADDMQYLTPSERVQRGGEAFVNTGLSGLGAAIGGAGGMLAGPVTAGAGAIGGGIAGGKIGGWLEDAMLKTGVADKPFLASSIARDRRETQQFLDAKKQEILARQAKAAAPAAAPPEAPPVAEAAPAMRNEEDLAYKLPEEEVVAQPSMTDLKRGWADESAAIDARMAKRARDEQQRLHLMRLQNDANSASYDARQATDVMSRRMYNRDQRNALLAREAQAKEALNAFHQGLRGEGIVDTQLAASRVNHQGDEAMKKYIADQGLRSHMYTADAAERSRRANLKLQYLQLRQQIGEKNMEDMEKMIGARSKVYVPNPDGKGPPVLDEQASNAKGEAYRRFFATASTLNPAQLKAQYGVSRIEDLARPQGSVAWDRLDAQMQLSKNASMPGVAIEGPARGVRGRERSFWDFLNDRKNNVESNIDFLDSMGNAVNIFADPMDNFVAETAGVGGKTSRKTISDLVTNRASAEALLKQMQDSGTHPDVLSAFKKRYGL